MKETPARSPSLVNGVDLSGRFVPDGDPNAAPHTFREKVAQRAYLLYLESAAIHGHDVEHWLLAEQQIRAQVSPPLSRYSFEMAQLD